MSSTWRRYSIVGLAAILMPVSLLNFSPRTAAEAPAHVSLVGQLLIASPSMRDPRFDRTVILMVQHSRDGAFGIVINRPLGERPLARVLEMLGEKETGVSGSLRIFAGGPVQPELGFVIYSTDYLRPETIDIVGRAAMTSSREILRDIAYNKGPKKSLVAFGYAGWAPGPARGRAETRGVVHRACRASHDLR